MRITRFLFEPTLLTGESGFVCGINAFNGLRKHTRGHPPALAGSNNYEAGGIVGLFFLTGGLIYGRYVNQNQGFIR